MKFTQCARARLVDASFAEAPRAARPLLLASTMLVIICSWPLSGAGTPASGQSPFGGVSYPQ